MAASRRFHSVTVVRDKLNPETRRTERLTTPTVVINLAVTGLKHDRVDQVELTEHDLLRLCADATEALARIKGARR